MSHNKLVDTKRGREGKYSQKKMFVNALCFPGGAVVKNPLAMQETSCNGGHMGWILGWGKSPGENYGTHFSILALGNPMDREAWQATVHGITKSQIRLSD